MTQGQSLVYDPFMGSGTTNLVAKKLGFNSCGVEAHPFVIEITKSKMHWNIRRRAVLRHIASLSDATKNTPAEKEVRLSNEARFPELVLKCFLPESLYTLGTIRDSISVAPGLSGPEKRFMKTALICTLRDVSIAATGWPYIAPKKIKITSMSKDALATYSARVVKMLDDLDAVRAEAAAVPTSHQLTLGSSTKTQIESGSVDHIFTSPPYLNNFDYADRTRLEMYFMGDAASWGEISTSVRTKLMTSATTQIRRGDDKYLLDPAIKDTRADVHSFLMEATGKLGELRKTKGGKKSYDLLVSGYFNDIHKIIVDNHRVLKSGGTARYILGDSAPYGVHIPTDALIGDLGLGAGFSECSIEVLRTRGDKWAANPQRHSVALRESIVTLRK
jgi:DNA modification methylase